MSPLAMQKLLVSGQLKPLSLAAAKTPYTAEYLSLLVRKGRLPAVKISRDWLTTDEAVMGYLKKQEIRHKKFLNRLRFKSRCCGIK